MATPKTSLRLTEEDRRKIEAIRARHGITSDAEVIRYALHQVYRAILIEPAAPTPAAGIGRGARARNA